MAEPAWAELAYSLWRRKRYSWQAVQWHLHAEGWDVPVPVIADVVMGQVARRFNLKRASEARPVRDAPRIEVEGETHTGPRQLPPDGAH